MPALAIDIGSYSIKILSGKPGAKLRIELATEVFNSSGIVVPSDDQTKESLKKVLENIFNDYKLSKDDVRLALPESVISSKIIAIPPLSSSELASAIDWQAEQHIPIPPE